MPLVTLTTYTSPFEAEIVRGRLEAEGIPAVVADAEMVTADWMMSQAIGGVKLRVPASALDRAREILSEDDPAEDAEPIPEAEILAWRALQAAAVGLALPPLQLYAVWLLVRYARIENHESPKTVRRVMWAVVFLLPYVVLLGLILWG
ncbi:MAG: DUF2007 domain-containing protein [Bacteroidota bacterium]